VLVGLAHLDVCSLGSWQSAKDELQCCVRRSQCKLRLICLISEAAISGLPFSAHFREHWLVNIDVDEHFALGGMRAVEPARILGERAALGDRQREEQRGQPSVVEAFAEKRPMATSTSSSTVPTRTLVIRC
jgi:hypothetical protein